MRRILSNNLPMFSSLLLIASVLWLGVFGLIAMNHLGGVHSGCPVDFIGSANEAQPMDSSFCATAHLEMIEQLAQAIPGASLIGLGGIGLMFLFATLLIGAIDPLQRLLAIRHARHRDKPPFYIYTAFSQIAHWTSLRSECYFLYRLI